MLLRPGTRRILGRAHVPVEDVGETPGSLPEEGAGFGVVLGFPVAGPCPNPWGRVPFHGAASPSPRPHRGPGALHHPLHPGRNWVRAARTRLRPRRLSGLAPGGGHTHTGRAPAGLSLLLGQEPPQCHPLMGSRTNPIPAGCPNPRISAAHGGFWCRGRGFFFFFGGREDLDRVPLVGATRRTTRGTRGRAARPSSPTSRCCAWPWARPPWCCCCSSC